jgi:hypothetical protein
LPPFQGLLCTAAGDVDEIGGSMMTSTQFTAGGDKDANADALTTPLLFADSQVNSLSPNSGDVARYNVNLPQGGNWYIWGRFYYDDPAGNGANSFFAKFDSQAAKKFGNNRDFMNVWHYDGDGDVETGAPTALLLGNVSGGQHQVTIEKREVETVPPRLDVFCLAQIPDPAPTDEEVCQALGGCSAPTTTTSTTLSSSTTMFETTTTMFETTTTTSSTSTSTTMPVQIPGDLDGDGEVSASDALDGARAAVGSGTCAPCVCDLNGDGRVTIVDALIVLKLATGQTPEINPPACA